MNNKKCCGTSHPCKDMEANKIRQSTMQAMKNEVKRELSAEWSKKYIELQKEVVEEAARWSKRCLDLEQAYKHQLEEVRYEYEMALEEGYAEAYELLTETKNKADESDAQVEMLKKALAEYETKSNGDIQIEE